MPLWGKITQFGHDINKLLGQNFYFELVFPPLTDVVKLDLNLLFSLSPFKKNCSIYSLLLYFENYMSIMWIIWTFMVISPHKYIVYLWCLCWCLAKRFLHSEKPHHYDGRQIWASIIFKLSLSLVLRTRSQLVLGQA